MNAQKAKIISGTITGLPRRCKRQARHAGRPHGSIESPRMAERPAVLELRGITKRFPGIVANDHIDFDLRRGRGARPAGRERRRQVDADERRLRALPAGRGRDPASRASRSSCIRRSDAIQQGIGMVHQHFMLIPVMTVAENIVLGDEPNEAGIFLDHSAADRRVRGAREDASTSRSTRTRASQNISVGQQQRVEILKALYRHADILILDEPTAVLTPQEATDLFEILRTLTARRHVGHLHQPQAPRGARDRRPHQRAAPRQAGRHRAARGRHRAGPRRADGRARGRAAHREDTGPPGRPAASTSRTSPSRTTAACRPCAASASTCGRGRSSASPASTATARPS